MTARLRAAAVPLLLYAVCATYAMAYLRLLFVPSTPWIEVAVAIAAVAAVGGAARLVRPRAGRIAVLVAGAVAGFAVVIGLRRGAWPWREDLRGRDGYLGAGGYLEEVVDAVRDAAIAWVQVIFPADPAAEPDAVAVVRVIALLLLLVCAGGLLAFRVPLLGVLAAAAAATPVTLFVVPDRPWIHGAALCLLALVVLAGAGRVERARPLATGALAVGALAIVAIAVAAVPGVTRPSALPWTTWTVEQPEPVSVAFVWDQQLRPIDFGGEPVPVIEVDDPDVGYLRVGTLDVFDGYRWLAAPEPIETIDAGAVTLPGADDGADVRRVEIRNVAVRTADLPLPTDAVGFSGLPVRVRPITVMEGGTVALGGELPIGERYAVEVASPSREALRAARAAAVTPTEPGELRVDDGIYPPFGEPGREQEVPRVLREQIRGDIFASSTVYGWTEAYAEVQALTADASTPYEAASIVENWFRTTFTYDETASYVNTVLGPLPAFLLSTERAAHCQYFAGSMAVLLRMLGIPARVAYGFSPGEVDGGTRVVTNRDAHAWVEVRLPEAGWVVFDPTPPRAGASTISSSTGVAPSDILLPGGVVPGAAGAAEALPLTNQGPNRGAAEISVGGTAGEVDAASPWPRRVAVAGAALIAIALAGALIWVAKLLLVWRARRTDDPRRGAGAAYAELAGWVDDQGIDAGAGSAADLGASVDRAFGVPTERWVDAVVLARYGPPADAADAIHVVRAETRRITGELRRRSTRRERVRGAVRVRRLLDRL